MEKMQKYVKLVASLIVLCLPCKVPSIWSSQPFLSTFCQDHRTGVELNQLVIPIL